MRLTFKELKEKIDDGPLYKTIPDDARVYLRNKKGYEYIEIRDKYDDYIIRVNHLNEDKITEQIDIVNNILRGLS